MEATEPTKDEKADDTPQESRKVLMLRQTLRDVDKKIGIVLRDTKETKDN